MNYDNRYGNYDYEKLDVFKYNDIKLSTVYYNSALKKVMIIDHAEILNTDFSYKRYCQKQNEIMSIYGNVQRFFEKDDDIEKFLASSLCEGSEFNLGTTFNRETSSIDPSPLEGEFETCFIEAYGAEALKYLRREYAFLTYDGKTSYIDYALFRKDNSWLAIEENGITYHHPAIIGEKKYKGMLKKQNSVIGLNGQLYRWDTQSLLNREQIIDELKEFIGDISQYIIQNKMTSKRNFVLYDHQVDYLKELYLCREEGKTCALVVLPTGTGKTIMALEDMKRFSDVLQSMNILIAVPTIDLVQQWKNEVEKYQNKSWDVNVMTYAGIARRYRTEISEKYDYIVIDEAHHGMAPVMKKVINHYQPGFLLGLTATDKRLDARKLESVFGEYEVKLDLKEAIEKGLLSPIRAFRLETNIDLSEIRFNGKDYVNAQLERSVRVESRNELIADVLFEYFHEKLSGKSGIVFCVSVSHAKEMASLLRAKGFKAESVDGEDRYRTRKIEKYMSGEIQFICTCSLLTEGWDAPRTSIIVMARPTMSKVLYTQQLGRGTRNYPGKEALYVIDVVDSYGSLGSISNRPWSVHSLFDIDLYKAFGDLFGKTSATSKEIEILGTTQEEVIKLQLYDLFTFEKAYENYLSLE